MPKRVFSIFFSFLFAFLACLTPICASAYEVTSFKITARNGMLVSLDTNEILYENKIDEKLYPASITKIMTATIMLESDKFNPDGKITMTKEALDLVLGTGSSVSYIKEGEEFTQLDLVYLVLMSSYGDCTYLAAEFYGGSTENFVDMMNQKAADLGLTSTHYENPVGLHHEMQYTTVRDIYTLTKYALKNETFKTVCETARYTMPATNMSKERTLVTTNFLQDKNTNYFYQYAHGIKTGFTDEAGRCLVSTASYNGYNYMCILMGCPNQAGKRYEFIESADLYRWAFKNFSFKEVANSKEPVCEIPVELSFETDFMPLYFKEPFLTILPNEADESTIIVNTKFKNDTADAPIKKGQVLGTADIIYAERVIGTVELVAGTDVKASGLLILARAIKNIFTSVYVKILLVVLAIGIAIFIALCIKLNFTRIKKRTVKYIPYKEEKRGTNHEK